MVIISEDIFTVANIIFTIGTVRLFLQVIKNRSTLKDFDFTGSVGITDGAGSITAPGGVVDIGAYEAQTGTTGLSSPRNLRVTAF